MSKIECGFITLTILTLAAYNAMCLNCWMGIISSQNARFRCEIGNFGRVSRIQQKKWVKKAGFFRVEYLPFFVGLAALSIFAISPNLGQSNTYKAMVICPSYVKFCIRFHSNQNLVNYAA